MKQAEYEALLSLVRTEGWGIYLKMLDQRIEDKYKTLRSIKNMDDLSKVNGCLDGLEIARNLVDQEIADFK